MDTIVSSELITTNTTAYGKHILSNHFSSPIDGFKKVRRRILYARHGKLDAKFGGLDLISGTIRFHHYSDNSIYDTGTRMADTFRSTIPLLTNHGRGGSYSGNKAASLTSL